MLYFLEEAGQMAAIAFGKDIDEDLDHVAAVFHEVESNDRYDEEFDDRPGNGKDGLDEVGDALDAVIADLDEGIVDDFLDLVRDIELGLLIFKLRHQAAVWLTKSLKLAASRLTWMTSGLTMILVIIVTMTMRMTKEMRMARSMGT